VFQPLLYQVATAVLSPADIASPIRHILWKQKNCRVVLLKITGVDVPRRRVLFEGGSAEFDYLIVAAGATHSYFGNDHWATIAPGLKSLEDATEIRRRVLLAFENAEYEGSETRRRAALTFAIVGGGPTGVELAGAIKEIAAKTIPADFRNVDTATTRVILIEGSPRLLAAFPEDLSARAQRDLEQMGVEVRVNTRVTNITSDGVSIGDELVAARNVFWAAGVRGSPLGESLGVPLDRAGRVLVRPDLTIPTDDRVFVVGDLAAAHSADTNRPVAGVAQAAIQMGRYAAKVIAREVSGSGGTSRKPFSYIDKGSMATIGARRAVADIWGRHFAGFFAWLLWGAVHILFLVSFRNRLAVVFNWLWTWLSSARGARLITGPARLEIAEPPAIERVYPETGKSA
jgi:NADH dehydrogenase